MVRARIQWRFRYIVASYRSFFLRGQRRNKLSGTASPICTEDIQIDLKEIARETMHAGWSWVDFTEIRRGDRQVAKSDSPVITKEVPAELTRLISFGTSRTFLDGAEFAIFGFR